MGSFGSGFGGGFDTGYKKAKKLIDENKPVPPEIAKQLLDKMDALETQVKMQGSKDKIYFIVGIIGSAVMGYLLGKFL